MLPSNVSLKKTIGDGFVGITFDNEKLTIHYPESYALDSESDSIRQDLYALIRSLRLSKSLEKNTINSTGKYANGCDLPWDSFRWLIKDYCNNGLIDSTSKIYRWNQAGKINWKRTYSKPPLLSNKSLVYLDTVHETKIEVNTDVVMAHRIALKKSIDCLGWLYGIDSKFLGKVPYNKINKYVHAIKTELKHSFNDRRISLLNRILDVLRNGDAGRRSENFTYGVSSYHYVYERMIDSLFSTVSDNEKFNPYATWHLKYPQIDNIRASSLRPDTIMIIGRVAYIIDSKYYRFGVTANPEDLPDTSSIEKQITYAEHLETFFSDDIDRIYNIFIIPYDKYNNRFGLHNDLEYVGYSAGGWIVTPEGRESTYQHIYTMLIDFRSVLREWGERSNNRWKDKLMRIVLEIADDSIILDNCES